MSAREAQGCQCGHLTDERMGYAPDARAAREHPGPHHTPIRCGLYRPRATVKDGPENVEGVRLVVSHETNGRA